jgi:hypothetical protein
LRNELRPNFENRIQGKLDSIDATVEIHWNQPRRFMNEGQTSESFGTLLRLLYACVRDAGGEMILKPNEAFPENLLISRDGNEFTLTILEDKVIN